MGKAHAKKKKKSNKGGFSLETRIRKEFEQITVGGRGRNVFVASIFRSKDLCDWSRFELYGGFGWSHDQHSSHSKNPEADISVRGTE